MNMDAEKLREGVEKLFKKRLTDYQLKFLIDCFTRKRVTARMARQSGKTMTLSIYTSLFALKNQDKQILIVAPTDKQAANIFNKIKRFLAVHHSQVPILDADTMRYIRLSNGCEILAMTTGDDGLSIRGQTAHVLIIDESAYIKESIYNEVLLPTIAATKGQIIEISTPLGKTNHFYKHHISQSWLSHHVPWQEGVKAGILSKEIVDEARETSTTLQFSAEWEAEFIDAATAYFPWGLIESCISEYPLIQEATL